METWPRVLQWFCIPRLDKAARKNLFRTAFEQVKLELNDSSLPVTRQVSNLNAEIGGSFLMQTISREATEVLITRGNICEKLPPFCFL